MREVVKVVAHNRHACTSRNGGEMGGLGSVCIKDSICDWSALVLVFSSILGFTGTSTSHVHSECIFLTPSAHNLMHKRA